MSVAMFLVGLALDIYLADFCCSHQWLKNLRSFLASLESRHLSIDSSPLESCWCSEARWGLAATPIRLHPKWPPSPHPQGQLFFPKGIQEILDTFCASACQERLQVAKSWPSLSLNRQKICSRAAILWGFSSKNPKQKWGLKPLFCFWCFLRSACLEIGNSQDPHLSPSALPSLSFSSFHHPPTRDGYFSHVVLIGVLPV